jgi:hypothetical protein
VNAQQVRHRVVPSLEDHVCACHLGYSYLTAISVCLHVSSLAMNAASMIYIRVILL